MKRHGTNKHIKIWMKKPHPHVIASKVQTPLPTVIASEAKQSSTGIIARLSILLKHIQSKLNTTKDQSRTHHWIASLRSQ